MTPYEMARLLYACLIGKSIDPDKVERISTELTDHQLIYSFRYYYNWRTMQQIAEEFDVTRTTVCRTIGRARKKITAITGKEFPPYSTYNKA